MLGAMIGDYIGSPYEFSEETIKSEDFPLFSGKCRFTDDSVMTAAIAKALMDSILLGVDLEKECVISMRRFGKEFPRAGYGGGFRRWLNSPNPKPYGSWGNGSAMRVSSVGWLFDTLEKTEDIARITAAITHDHPDGIKGAQAIAVSVFLARNGYSKPEIKQTIEHRYGYDLNRTVAQIRPDYSFDVSCNGSVPESIIAFLESSGFEDAIRKSVSLGGDTDTTGCMTGAISQAFYSIPQDIERKIIEELPDSLLNVVSQWNDNFDLLTKRVKDWRP